MKKISLLLAMVMILAVAAPVMAGPFSDVPATHWAYDALQTVSSRGIITGYPDGTFKGSKTLTRYEIAIVVSRILDAVAAERAMLAEKVDALEDGLTAGQAEDVIAIFKSLIVNTPVKSDNTPVVVPADTLSAAQAEEVAGIVEALVMEFKFELEAIGADIAAIQTDVEALDARVTALEEAKPSVVWNGTWGVNLVKTDITGTAYTNPYDLEAGKYTAKNDTFEQALTIGMDINKGAYQANVNFTGATDLFGTWAVDGKEDIVNPIAENSGLGDTMGLEFTDFNATVTNGDVVAKVDNGQSVTMKDYLIADSAFDGVVVTNGENTYVLARNKQAVKSKGNEVLLTAEDYAKLDAGYQQYFEVAEDADGNDRTDADGNLYYVVGDTQWTVAEYEALETNDYSLYNSLVGVDTNEDDVYDHYVLSAKSYATVEESYNVNDVLAVKQGLGLLDSTVFVGMNNVFEDKFVVGIESGYDVLGIDLNTEFATDDANFANKLFRVSAARNIGALELAGSYKMIDEDFAGILADIKDESGYDASATLPVGNLTFDGSYAHTADENTMNYGVALAETALLGLNLNADANQERMTESGAIRTKANVDVTTSLLGINVDAGYTYDQFNDEGNAVYVTKKTVNDYLVVMDANDNTKVDHLEYQYDIYGGLLTKSKYVIDDELNNVNANLNWDTFVPGLTVGADYVYGLTGDVDGEGLTTHNYNADFAMGILTAGVDQNMIKSKTVLDAGLEYSIFKAGIEKELNAGMTVTASVDPEEFNVFGFGVDTVANFEMVDADVLGTENAMNYDLGVDVTKTVDAFTMTAGYEYANHGIDNVSTDALVGTKKEVNAGVSYAFSDSISATVDFANIEFAGTGWVEDKTLVNTFNQYDAGYFAQQINAGMSFSF